MVQTIKEKESTTPNIGEGVDVKNKEEPSNVTLVHPIKEKETTILNTGVDVKAKDVINPIERELNELRLMCGTDCNEDALKKAIDHFRSIKKPTIREIREVRYPERYYLTGKWQGFSVHKKSGDKTFWNEVQLEFNNKNMTFTGTGKSSWHLHNIAFNIENGTFTKEYVTFTKRHLDVKFNNSVLYEKCIIQESPTNIRIVMDEQNVNLTLELVNEEPNEKNENNGINCTVCLDQPKDCLLQPCNHVCVCQFCSQKLDKCPIWYVFYC